MVMQPNPETKHLGISMQYRYLLIIVVCSLLGTKAFSEENKTTNTDVALQGIKSKNIGIKKRTDSEQIDISDGESKKSSGAVTILDEPGRQGVSMKCFVTDNGHNVRITVNNTNTSPRTCQSVCYYRDNDGYDWDRRCNGSVVGRYNGIFCDWHESNKTFTVTNPGSFDCER